MLPGTDKTGTDKTGTDKPNDPQPEPADSSAPAAGQDIDEGGEFIARQVLEKDATFFGG
jgi:hypothetical protein